MAANALIYHPTVAQYMRFVATTVGRDKSLRLVQYFSRFYAWYLYRTNNPQSAIDPYDAAKKQVGLTRKILRVGKFVEHFKAAATAADSTTIVDPLLKYLAVARQLGYAGYLALDSMTVLDAAGIKKWGAAKTVQREAMKFWLVGLVSSVLAGVYSLRKLRQRSRAVDKKEGEGAVESKKVAREWNVATLQLACDLADMTVPATFLGIVNLDDGIVGLLGTFSSLVGMFNAWERCRV